MSLASPSRQKCRRAAASTKLALAPAAPGLATAKTGPWEALLRAAAVRRLSNVSRGRLTLVDPMGRQAWGDDQDGSPQATVEVRDPRCYRLLAAQGSLGAAEAYFRHYWSCDDLVSLFRLLARNTAALQSLDFGWSRVQAPLRWIERWLRRNTLGGSRRNIAAHYDLSNDLFALFLDSTMTYSAGIFEHPHTTLEQASLAKYDRLCRRLQLTADDHVLEIGAGWGGFALYAASRYGCRVTTTTISRQQYEYAHRQITAAHLEDRITLLYRDYRQLDGRFDKLVSIEMIEAVGHENLPGYFRKCRELLEPGGLLALQAITMPEQRYRRYRRTTDFIRQYIFPGGCLPSNQALTTAAAGNGFRLLELKDFAQHYARTVALWRRRFRDNLPAVRTLGFDERFIRAWEYYLCYCEAGFLDEQIGLAQVVWRKPS